MQNQVPQVHQLLVGDIVADKYELDGLVARGGMAAVYRAHHRLTKRCVALKFLQTELSEHPDVVLRFQREAETAASIASAHIVEIIDVGIAPHGVPFIAMEFLEGEDLASMLEREGPLSTDCAIRYMIQTCRGLSAAHHRGIIHRDIKPSNIFLAAYEDGVERIKILDFGIAKLCHSLNDPDLKLTITGTALGTPRYMSPEQAQGEPGVDSRTDVYGVGVTLYELITGQPPFSAQSLNRLIYLISTTEPPPPSQLCANLNADLERVILRAMARDRDQRYQKVDDLLDALLSLEASVAQNIPLPQASSQKKNAATVMTTDRRLLSEHAVSQGSSDLIELGQAPYGRLAPFRRFAIFGLGLVCFAAALFGFYHFNLRDSGEEERAPQVQLMTRTSSHLPEGLADDLGPLASKMGQLDASTDDAEVTTDTVEVRIQVEPATSALLIDGVTVEERPYINWLPRKEAKHRIEAYREGYLRHVEHLAFDRDRNIAIHLVKRRQSPVASGPTRPARSRKKSSTPSLVEFSRNKAETDEANSLSFERENPYLKKEAQRL